MAFRLWRVLYVIARLGRPVLRILGVKGGTAAEKAAEVAEVLDETIGPSCETQPQPKPPK